MTQRKIVFVLIDGLGDISLPILSNQTTLQYAKTPNFDKLAGVHLVYTR
jgi:2,3-bisphosphoglycerate-independent phosphoglycerate mutase